MAKALSQSGGCRGLGKKSAATSEKPKKLSKAAEWHLKHPNGLELIYADWKAVMR